MKKLSSSLAFAALGVLILVGTGRGQEFQKTYRLGAGGSIGIKNVSGNVSVTGYDGDVVIVNGYKEGSDREMVEVTDNSSGDHVEVGVRYPERCNCDASVRFEVQVPRSVKIDIRDVSTASGDISVTGVRGDVRVNTASGDVAVSNVTGAIKASTASGEMRVKDVVGSVNAQSASGNVEVLIAQLEGTENMKFSSASGDVSVRLPANLDADVNLSTATGSIKTDFPIEVKESRYGPGSQARGRIGNGAQRISIQTASGDVSLMRY